MLTISKEKYSPWYPRLGLRHWWLLPENLFVFCSTALSVLRLLLDGEG